MKKLLCAALALTGVAVGTVHAQDLVFKPIDTQRLVVQPTRTAANLAAQSIDVVGRTTASSLEGNGYVKTINNLFGRTILAPRTQVGRSALPSPNLFPSTQYKSYNMPVMPSSMPRR